MDRASKIIMKTDVFIREPYVITNMTRQFITIPMLAHVICVMTIGSILSEFSLVF